MKKYLKLGFTLIIMLGLFSCNSDKKLYKIIDDLNSQNDSIRFKAIEKLEGFKLTLNQQIILLEEARENFPSAEYEWESIPGKMIEKATKKQNLKLISIIKDNFSDYDRFAKNVALSFLSNFDNNTSIQTFKELVLQYPTEINYLPVGVLNDNYSYKDIIFPDLFKLIEQESTDSDIMLLFLNYLNANQLKPQDFKDYIDKFLVLSKKYREIIVNRQSLDIDFWDDEDYQNARFKAGVIADLLGFFNDTNVVSELNDYLELEDNKLKMFAIISLIKLEKQFDIDLIEIIAADSECRKWLYDNLVSLRKAELFPLKYKSQKYFAESDMINWLLYPTELARMPDSIELMKIVEVDSKSEDGIVEFYLFRFKSNHKDWKDEGWMAGISGYFPIKEKPSTSGYGYTFSCFDKWDSKSPDEHIQEIKDLLEEAYEKQ